MLGTVKLNEGKITIKKKIYKLKKKQKKVLQEEDIQS